MSSGFATTTAQDAADLAAINAYRVHFAAVYNSNNPAAIAAHYEEDAVLMFPDQPAIEGRQRIQATLEGYFKQNTAKIAHTPLETHVAGDWAYERGNFSLTVTPKSGEPRVESMKYLVILRRQPDGSWAVHRDMENRNEPATNK